MKIELPFNYSQDTAYKAIPELAKQLRYSNAIEIYKELYTIGEVPKDEYANGLWELIDEMCGIKRK